MEEDGKGAEAPGSPSSSLSSSSSSSSSSDFYCADVNASTSVTNTLPLQASVAAGHGLTSMLQSSAFVSPPGAARVGTRPHQDPDAASSTQAMELSDPSRDPLRERALPTQSVGVKRKVSEALGTNGVALHIQDIAKRQKSSNVPAVARLPPELLQHVFLFLTPAMLCRCLQVSKGFRHLLTEASATPTSRKDPPRVHVLDSEVIWSQSRKSFYPNLPRPLMGHTELQMLQLIAGKACQFCGKPQGHAPGITQLTAGPGRNGLRVIWPFGIRTCGECLKAKTLTDTETLSTHKRFSRLRAGVKFGYLLPDLNFISETVRVMPGGILTGQRASKIYYKPALEAIEREEKEAQAYGEGAADEWHKGLQTKGKLAMADCARWEEYERRLRVDRPGATLIQMLRENDSWSFVNEQHINESTSKPAGVSGIQLQLAANNIHPLPQPVHVFPSLAPQAQQQSRPSKNPAQVEEIRRMRKLDIERRCCELIPSLTPEILQHVDSFHAALQIAQPMTDDAWELLRPRIMAQREGAELAEHERSARLAALQATLPVLSSDNLPKSHKEIHYREYEVAQQTLRTRLGYYADEIINGQWHGGKALTKESAPIFVVKVLRHVWNLYNHDQVAEPSTHSGTTTNDHDGKKSPSPEPFLSLDNMKWVYDHKVRPLADNHRRDHFLCSVCADSPSANSKWFAFESLIQHYGAKHTTAFSKGNIVVHWQSAPWPEEFPFHLEPEPWLKPERGQRDLNPKSRPRNVSQNCNEEVILPSGKAPNVAAISALRPTRFGNRVSHADAQFSSKMTHVSHNYVNQEREEAQHSTYAMQGEQVDKFADDAFQLWTALEGIEDSMNCIKVHTVLHHATLQFRKQFGTNPSLDLMTEVLLREQVRPLRNASGIACRICVANTSAPAEITAYYSRIRGVKLNNTWTLVAHFKLHLMEMPALTWTKDMIELPEGQLIRDLLQSRGMNDDKLSLIAAANPGIFSSPLPKIGKVPGHGPNIPAGTTGRLLERQSKKSKRKKHSQQNYVNGHAEYSQDILPEAAEHEYDPRRPLMMAKDEPDNDPSRFDTDLVSTEAREATPQFRQPPIQFNSATFAASQQDKGSTIEITEFAMDRYSRSPSVGRPHSRMLEEVSAVPLANDAQQIVTPDIAAILKTLTANARLMSNATPSSAIESDASNSHQHMIVDSHKSLSEVDQRADHYATQHGHINRGATAYSAQQLEELQVSLASNSRRSNLPQASMTSTTRVPADPEARYSPRHYSPPRHYVYDDNKRYEPVAVQSATFREPPVQYVPVAVQAREPIRVDYHPHYDRVQPVSYVDQYGRPLELIPIEAAPPPQIQYVSHSQRESLYHARSQAVYTTAPASGTQYQTVYDDPRQVYYDAT